MFTPAVSWILVTALGSCLSSELKVKSGDGTCSNTGKPALAPGVKVPWGDCGRVGTAGKRLEQSLTSQQSLRRLALDSPKQQAQHFKKPMGHPEAFQDVLMGRATAVRSALGGLSQRVCSQAQGMSGQQRCSSLSSSWNEKEGEPQ